MISTSISSVISDTLKLVRNQLLLSGVEQNVDVAGGPSYGLWGLQKPAAGVPESFHKFNPGHASRVEI